jgi:hypothetical protein
LTNSKVDSAAVAEVARSLDYLRLRSVSCHPLSRVIGRGVVDNNDFMWFRCVFGDGIEESFGQGRLPIGNNNESGL